MRTYCPMAGIAKNSSPLAGSRAKSPIRTSRRRRWSESPDTTWPTSSTLRHADLATSLRTLATTRQHDPVALIAAAEAQLKDTATLTARSASAGPARRWNRQPGRPLAGPGVSPHILEILDVLDLRPTFVGVNSVLARTAIRGDPSGIRAVLEHSSDAIDLVPDDTSSATRDETPVDRAHATEGRRPVCTRVIRLAGRTSE